MFDIKVLVAKAMALTMLKELDRLTRGRAVALARWDELEIGQWFFLFGTQCPTQLPLLVGEFLKQLNEAPWTGSPLVTIKSLTAEELKGDSITLRFSNECKELLKRHGFAGCFAD